MHIKLVVEPFTCEEVGALFSMANANCDEQSPFQLRYQNESKIGTTCSGSFMCVISNTPSMFKAVLPEGPAALGGGIYHYYYGQ